jgi:enoyl reductase-like protein
MHRNYCNYFQDSGRYTIDNSISSRNRHLLKRVNETNQTNQFGNVFASISELGLFENGKEKILLRK